MNQLVRRSAAARAMMPATRRANGGAGRAGAIVHRPLEGFEGASDPRSGGAAVGC
jgi:hypothetical protein